LDNLEKKVTVLQKRREEREGKNGVKLSFKRKNYAPEKPNKMGPSSIINIFKPKI
jgi:hypothetical protein